MRLHKIIQRRIRRERDGVEIASDVNVSIAGNVGERNAATHVSSRQQAGATDSKRDTRR